MSLSWQRRKGRLAALLGGGDEDADGVALDRLMHGQNIIGKTGKTVEIDSLRFNDRDLEVVGTLEYGQFGVIDVATCRLNNCVYVRKSIEKKFALRTRDQCSPQFERDLLLQAMKTQSPWAPHLLCAFQTPTHLKLVMDYAEGGTLWDVLESSPHDGRILEPDLKWWMPQVVSAIHWCHSQGFVHRDIKPHNFVLTSDAHILLIDFGSAAPLLPPNEDGSQLLPKQYCLVPCGTCDYISPEILQSHEEALVALEMDEGDAKSVVEPQSSTGYGLETDWWSLGAMFFEMAYGSAPFFASDIRSTYLRIMNHEKSLKFNKNIGVSHELQHFLRRLLTHAAKRLGRRNVMEITDHPIFDGVDWRTLSAQNAPTDLHLPQFVYSEPKPKSTTTAPPPPQMDDDSNSTSQAFAFSALFQSSSASPALSTLRPSPAHPQYSLSSSNSAASFIGFSWGPPIDAFPEDVSAAHTPERDAHSTPQPLLRTSFHIQQTPLPAQRAPTLSAPLTWGPGAFSTPGPLGAYSTPMKPYSVSPHATLPRTSTVRRTAPRRNVSDREAMKQLVDCVGMSARKKVLESGRKPKLLSVFASRPASSNGTGARNGSVVKELRFDKVAAPIPAPDYSRASSARERSRSRSHSRSNSASRSFSRILANSNPQPSGADDTSDIYYYSTEIPADVDHAEDVVYSSSETTDSEGGAPPSPSPSPRPGSAMSMLSMTMLSRRSGTPTVSSYLGSVGLSSGASALRRIRSGSGSGLVPSSLSGDRSATATFTMTNASGTTPATSSGLLSVPPTAAADNQDFMLGLPPPREREDLRVEEKSSSSPKMGTVVECGRTSNIGDWATMSASLVDPSLDDLERRHADMMRDIEHLEERFDRVSMSMHR